jgi:hypothetical protein
MWMSSTLDVFAEGQTIMAYRVEDRHLRSAYGCDKFLGAHHDTVPSRKLRISPCGLRRRENGSSCRFESYRAHQKPRGCQNLAGPLLRAPCLQRTVFAAGWRLFSGSLPSTNPVCGWLRFLCGVDSVGSSLSTHEMSAPGSSKSSDKLT